MKTREECKQTHAELATKFEEAGVKCKWMIESGGVVIKRDGTRMLSFSLRDEATFAEDVKKMIAIVEKQFPNGYKLTSRKNFNTFRPEGRVVISIG